MALHDSVQSLLQSYYQNQISPKATITDLQALGDGWETDVFAYRLHVGGETRSLVLRVYSGGDNALLRARNEYHVMKTLHTASYPVPEVLHFQPDQSYLGGYFLIMERVPGSSLQSQLNQRPELLNLFCSLLFNLHQVDWRPFIGGTSPWQNLTEAQATFELDGLSGLIARYGFSESFRPLLNWMVHRSQNIETRHAIIHGDYHPFNILVDQDGSLAVVDWGSACVTDPRVDVANAIIMAHAFGNPELATAILNGYEALAGETLRDLDYFQTLVLTRRLATMVIAIVHGGDAVGLRVGTDEHLRQNGHLAQAVHDYLTRLTGLSMPELQQVLSQFA